MLNMVGRYSSTSGSTCEAMLETQGGVVAPKRPQPPRLGRKQLSGGTGSGFCDGSGCFDQRKASLALLSHGRQLLLHEVDDGWPHA
jgi:hypothetical protein